MADSYLTIEAPAQSCFREKMSRFLAFAHPVETVEQARAVIADYQKDYHDARHVCWAYMLGSNRDTFLSSDNGEPSGTAGRPILGQINSFGLSDIVIVVVRYFGGIKLGTPGLIAAYRQAARQAIEEAVIVERHKMAEVSFVYPYLVMNDVMKIAKSPGISILAQEFDNSCSMTLAVRADHIDALRRQLADIDGLTF